MKISFNGDADTWCKEKLLKSTFDNKNPKM